MIFMLITKNKPIQLNVSVISCNAHLLWIRAGNSAHEKQLLPVHKLAAISVPKQTSNNATGS